MPDDRPESPEERLRELNGQIAAVAGRLRCSDDAAVREEGDRLAAAVKSVRAALSTPAGPPLARTTESGAAADSVTFGGKSAPSPREDAVEAAAWSDDEIEAATDAILALNRTEDDYSDGQRLTWRMARRRAIAALSATRPSSPTPEEKEQR